MTEHINNHLRPHNDAWQALKKAIAGKTVGMNAATNALIRTQLIAIYGPAGHGFAVEAIDQLITISKKGNDR